MISLRPYQTALVDQTRKSLQSGKRSTLLVSPCGSGKTVMFSYFAQRVTQRGKRTLILAHRDELIDQISDTLRLFNVNHSFIAAGRDYVAGSHVHVGSVFTVAKRLGKIHAPDIIIIDEAHHARASTWEKIFETFPKAWRIGVTASPQRLSGEALGDIFDEMILGPTIPELVKLGHLAPYKLYVPSTINTDNIQTRAEDFARDELEALADRSTITGEAVKEYAKFANRKRAIAFCVSVAHAQHVAERFQLAGYTAMCIDGSMPRDVRRSIVKRFRDGGLHVLTSCDLISEGFDLPAIECAIMLRPTQSLALWIQQSGRALRPFPGKSHAIILDHAGNCLRHGLPDEVREWTLDGKDKAASKIEVRIRVCEICFGANESYRDVCQYCGAPFPKKPREVEQVEGELVEVDPQQLALKLKFKREQGQAQTFGELMAIAKARGYKKPGAWAAIILKARQAKKLAESGSL